MANLKVESLSLALAGHLTVHFYFIHDVTLMMMFSDTRIHSSCLNQDLFKSHFNFLHRAFLPYLREALPIQVSGGFF
jgi:hypothetical protein